MPQHTLLVVDDDTNVRTLLREYFTEQGFRVETVADGRTALISARQARPDLILLDVMMPEMDGLEFIRHHRKEQETPIILLTARVEETDKIIGLELGADDYVTKPFSMRELLARVRALLRRSQQTPGEPEVLEQRDIVLDKTRHLVLVKGKSQSLTPTEFELLATLMAAPGRVYSRAQLLERLHEIAIEGVERTIDVHIRNLRTKIEENPKKPVYIETVFGIGYRFTSAEA